MNHTTIKWRHKYSFKDVEETRESEEVFAQWDIGQTIRAFAFDYVSITRVW